VNIPVFPLVTVVIRIRHCDIAAQTESVLGDLGLAFLAIGTLTPCLATFCDLLGRCVSK